MIDSIKETQIQLIEYIKSTKTEEEVFYNPNIHKGWKRRLYLDEENPYCHCIFLFEMKDGNRVYTISDKNGFLNFPENSAFSSIKITENPIVEVKKTPLYKLKIFAGGVFFLVVVIFGVFGEPIADYLKEANDPIRNARESAVKEYNEGLDVLLPALDSVRSVFGSYYVYTNDTSKLTAYMYPNLQFYENPNEIDFVALQGKANTVKQFLKKSDTLGYNIWLETISQKFRMGNISEVNDEFRYKLAVRYYYSDKEKEYLKENEEKYTKLTLGQKNIDDEQAEIVVFSQMELNVGELETSLKRVIAPRIDLKNPSYKFYFSSYSDNLSISEFEEQVALFAKMFLSKQNLSNCRIRTVDWIEK